MSNLPISSRSARAVEPGTAPGPAGGGAAQLPLLQAERVSYSAGGRVLVQGLTVELRPGRFIGVVGPNGAGKSTLLRLLNGLLAPAGGTVLLDGENLDRMTPERVARSVARVPQVLPSELDFTALEVVLMGRYARSAGWSESQADREAAGAALASTGMSGMAHRLYSTLSGGERQRVIIARALAQEPAVLLLDEPTASLDLRHQLEVLQGVRRLVAGGRLAAVAAIHDISLAARFCDELLVMDGGRAVAGGAPAEVLTPAVLERVFGVDAVVEHHPALGHLTVHVRAIAGGWSS